MPISNPEVDAGDKANDIIGYKKRRLSLKQRLAGFPLKVESISSLDFNEIRNGRMRTLSADDDHERRCLLLLIYSVCV